MYLNLYVPRLQYESGVVGFFRGHRGYTFASSPLMDPITKGFVAEIERFATRPELRRRRVGGTLFDLEAEGVGHLL